MTLHEPGQAVCHHGTVGGGCALCAHEAAQASWITRTIEYKALLARAEKAESLLSAAMKERRTPGTVEVCERCHMSVPVYMQLGKYACPRDEINCPFRSAQPQEGSGG